MIINKIEPQGFCNGVKYALRLVEKAINDPNIEKPIYLLGNLIHNHYAIEDLKAKGVKVINNKPTRLEMLDEINEGTVIFSAHGVSPLVYEKAKNKGLSYIDATCPNVLIIHSRIKSYLEKGYSIIYIGTKKHPECEGVLDINSSINLVTTSSDIDYLDISNKYIYITKELEIEDFYKTDTHWREENIVDVAEKIGKEMGTNVKVEYDVKTLENDFYGVYYGQSALPLEAEEIKYLTNDVLKNCNVFDYQNNKEISVYDMEKAEGKDPYEMFLGGPLSLVTIENEKAKTDKELIIFRDSFGSSIAPLLVEGYKKITLVDIRYMHPNLLENYIEFNSQDVLFLYSTSVLNNSETIK